MFYRGRVTLVTDAKNKNECFKKNPWAFRICNSRKFPKCFVCFSNGQDFIDYFNNNPAFKAF